MASVLVVDDSRLVRQSLVRALGDLFTVTDCAAAQTAIELIDQTRFDCLILNPLLAVNSGFELLYEIQSHQDLRDLPVVLLTHDRRYCYKHRATLKQIGVVAVWVFVDIDIGRARNYISRLCRRRSSLDIK